MKAKQVSFFWNVIWHMEKERMFFPKYQQNSQGVCYVLQGQEVSPCRFKFTSGFTNPYSKPPRFVSKCRDVEPIMVLAYKVWKCFHVLSNLLSSHIFSCSLSHTWVSAVWDGGVQLWSGAAQFIAHLFMYLKCPCSHRAQGRRKIQREALGTSVSCFSSVMWEEAAPCAITVSSSGAVAVSHWGLGVFLSAIFSLKCLKNISGVLGMVEGCNTGHAAGQGTQRQRAYTHWDRN